MESHHGAAAERVLVRAQVACKLALSALNDLHEERLQPAKSDPRFLWRA